MKRLKVLFVFLTLALTICGIKTINAETASPLNLSNVVIGDDDGGKNITYSTIDGVNFTVQTRAEAGSFVQAYLNMQEQNWSNAEYVYLQVNNPFWGEVGIGISLIDNDGTLFRSDVDWSDPVVNALPENNAKHNYWLMTSLDDSNPTLRYLGWGASFIPGSFTGYIKLPISVFDYRWGVKGENDNILDLTNITRVELDMDIFNNGNLKLTFGDIYQGNDALKNLAFDGSTVTKVEGEVLGSSYYLLLNGHDANMRDEIVKANQLSNFAVNTQNNANWSPFYAVIPTDISAYNGIQYYVDNTLENKEIFFNKFFREFSNGISGEEWYCDGGFARFIPDEGEEFVGGANIIPANFKGTIVVPFSNFALPGWFTPINGVKELNSVWWNFGFTFDLKIRTNKFIIKDFTLVSDAYQYIRLPQTVISHGDSNIVLPFEYYDDYDLNSDWFTVWDKAADANIELVDAPLYPEYGVSGKAMKFTCGSVKTVEYASNETALEHYPNTDAQKNIVDAKGVTFFIKNLSNKQIGFNLGLDLLVAPTTQQRWVSAINARYYLFDLKTGLESVNNAKDGIYVPDSFEGYIRISFDQLVNPSWETNSAPFDNTKTVAYMVINMNAVRHAGESFIMDSFGYYYSDIAITTTFNTPENTFAKAMSVIN